MEINGNEGKNKTQGVGAGGVGPFRICIDNVCLWHNVDCWANSGETGGVQGLHHHGALLSGKVRSQLA